jgi:hypothetical protein
MIIMRPTWNLRGLKMHTGSAYPSATKVAVLTMVASIPWTRTRFPAVAFDTGTLYLAW